MPDEETPSQPERLLSFGDRMRVQREARGWTQLELAKRASIDPAWINRLERGERQNMSLSVALRIARALRVSLDYLADTFGEGDDVPAGVDVMEVVPTPAGSGHPVKMPFSV